MIRLIRMDKKRKLAIRSRRRGSKLNPAAQRTCGPHLHVVSIFIYAIFVSNYSIVTLE